MKRPLKLDVRTQGVLLVSVPVGIALVLFGMLYFLLSSAEQTALEEQRVNAVLVKATQVFDMVEQAETVIRTAKDMRFGSIRTNIAYGPAPEAYKQLVSDLGPALNTPNVFDAITDDRGFLSRKLIGKYLHSNIKQENVKTTLQSLAKDWRVFAADESLDQDAFLRANGITFSSTPVSAYNLSRYLSLDTELMRRICNEKSEINLQKVVQQLEEIQHETTKTNLSGQRSDVLVQIKNSYYALAGPGALSLARLNHIGTRYTYAQQQSSAAMNYLPQRAKELMNGSELKGSDAELNKSVDSLTAISQDTVKLLSSVHDLINNQDRSQQAVAQLLQERYSSIRSDVEKVRSLTANLNISHEHFVEKRLSILQGLKMLVAAGIVLMIVVALTSARIFSNKIASRLAVLVDNSKRVMNEQPLNSPLVGNDEIADLDHVFHVMMSSLREKTRREVSIIQNAVDVICSIDSENRFSSVSPSSQTSWGFEPNELIGKRFTALIDPKVVDQIVASLNSSKANPELNFVVEIPLVKKDGSRTETLWSGIWSSEDSSLFCVAHDISERKKIDRLKQEFVQMISHDLRSPLTAVLTFLELIVEGFFESRPERLTKNAETTVKDVGRLLALVDSLLELEKMESGKLVSVPSDVELRALLEQSAESIRATAERKSIAINIANTKLQVHADANQIIQVLVNLLSNALKFSPPKSTISITTETKKTFVEISVSDEGRGVPLELRAKIFDRFEQVELDDSRVKGGTGLGLAICKAIIASHGGTIGVDGNASGGSRFWFQLPLSAAAPQPGVETVVANQPNS